MRMLDKKVFTVFDKLYFVFAQMKTRPARRKKHRILILVDIGWDYGRDIVQAARHYAFTGGRLEVGNIKLDGKVSLPQMIRQQKIAGIIAMARDRKLEADLMGLSIPVVNISNVLNPTRLPLVTQDDRAVGRLAAAHLLGCGCTSLAYWGQQEARFSQQRVEGFLEEISRRKLDIPCIAGMGRSLALDEGEPLLSQMRPWLKKLPPKTGVFAVLDPFALHLMQAAREIGSAIPQQIAVIGAGDDNFWVNFENIPLSSVKLPVWQIGLEAVRLLDELIHKKSRAGAQAAECRLLPVSEVAARQSTDVLFVEDVGLAKAIAYIRAHSAQNIYIPEVVRASGISRSGLQRRFAEHLNHSILDEVRSARVERIKTLLRTTDMKMTQIAEACDFPNTPRMHVLFRQHTGQSPGQYRKSFTKR